MSDENSDILAHCGNEALWHHVTVALGHRGIGAPWHCGTVAPWHWGTVARAHWENCNSWHLSLPLLSPHHRLLPISKVGGENNF